MDQEHQNQTYNKAQSASSAAKIVTDEESSVLPMRNCEIAMQELQKIKDSIDAHVDQITKPEKNSTETSSGCTQDSTNVSVPSDSTISEVSPQSMDGASFSVLFQAAKESEKPARANYLFPDCVRKEEYHIAGPSKIAASSGYQRPRKAADGVTRLDNLRAVFDSIATTKPSMSLLQKEYAENRIQSNKKICELSAEVTVKSKESEFLELQLARYHTELRAVKSEIANKDAENKQLREVISELESKSSKQILDLTLELQRKASRLETYERLYVNMDQLTYMDGQISGGWALENDDANSKVQIPVNLKYKLQQSMDLAQRLKEERDHLERCRDDADRKIKETETKYQGVLIELNKLKIGEDAKLTNAKASLQLKSFELGRVSLILEEYQQKYKAAISENEKLKNKTESLNGEFNMARCELNEEVTRLSLELQSKSSRLELYEKIEDALDEMILKAATVPDASIGNDLLGFLSAGPSLPTDARRRLQQAFDLAKKNCVLEKTVAEQKEEILNLYDERQALRQEVESVKSLNGYSVGQLVETITEKNREIGKLNNRIASIERDFCKIQQSNEVLQRTVDNLKIYHDQVLDLYHSGARVSQAKHDRTEVSPLTRATNDEVVSTTSSLRLPQRAGLHDSQQNTSNASIFCESSKAQASIANGASTLDKTDSCKMILAPGARTTNFKLDSITEEPEEDVFDSDSLQESVSSFTSSMFFPPPVVLRTREAYRVSVRKIPSKSSSATSSKQHTMNSVRKGQDKIHARQVVSADKMPERTKKKEKPVALRLSKVKPSASNFF